MTKRFGMNSVLSLVFCTSHITKEIKMFRPLLVIAVTAVCCVQANAAIIVSVGSATIAAGGTGYVDVRISSNNNDVLSLVGYQFQITGSNLNGDLTFRPDWNSGEPINPANQSNSEQNQPDYVLGTDTDPGPGYFTATLLSPTSLIGGDSTFSGADTSPLTPGDFLLARLELMHTTPNAALAVGSTFQVSLVNDPFFTGFYNNAGLAAFPDPIPLSLASFSPGNITVTSAAVPEPSSFAILGLVAAGGIFRSRWKNRKHRGSGTATADFC